MSKYYIARNKDGGLRMFKNKPAKNGWNFWDAIVDFPIKLRETWFPEVKWTDKEPKVLTIEESPWIKVEDRLPAVGEEVLQLNRMRPNGKLFCMVNSYKDDKWAAYAATHYDTIAWMPIPEFKE